jgi:hypothetical protein
MLVVLFFAGTSARPDEAIVEKAQKAARVWLEQVDKGDYAGSWDEASELFKTKVSKEQWEKAVRSVRGPLGELRAGKLQSAEYMKELPGVPDGEYVVIQYETSYENKASATETVTPMLDKDGQWRVSGYFIR